MSAERPLPGFALPPVPPNAELRVFSPVTTGPPTGPPLSADLTLTEFFEAYVLPVAGALWRPGTIKQSRESLRYWERLAGSPRLSQIDDLAAATFVRRLASLPGKDGTLADNTIRKHVQHLQQILDLAGPRTRDRPLARRLLDETPLLPKPSLVIPEVDDVFTVAEIGLAIEACTSARVPAGLEVSAPAWWRALFLLAYNSGLRIGSLLALRREWLKQDDLGHWCRVPGTAAKKRRGVTVYLNGGAKLAISWLPQTDQGPIFAWPHGEYWLHEQRRRILAASRIPPARRFGFHGFRKALATELGKYSPTAAAQMLGHSTGRRSITVDHYSHRSILVEAMEKLPQPPLPDVAAERQLRLF